MYTKQKLPVKLTDEERLELSLRNTEIDLSIMAQDAILQQARDAHKDATESDKKEKKANLKILEQGFEHKTLDVLEYVDQEQGTIQYLDEQGVIVYERALSIEERRQYRIEFGRRQLAN